MAECQDCGVIEDFPTQLQRERWVFKRHIGHTIFTWRMVRRGVSCSSQGRC